MQVSRAAQALDGAFEQWRVRALEQCPYVTLDATYQKVRIGGCVVSASVLVALGVRSDDHSGLKAALAATLPGIPWQRCQFHLQQNAQSYVSKLVLRSEVAEDIRTIFNATTEADAKQAIRAATSKYEKSEPKLSEWISENIEEGLAVLRFPPAHHKRLRTSNSIERLNKEIKRRTRVVGLFPNEASLLRLVTALALEVSEDWESGRIYLSMNLI